MIARTTGDIEVRNQDGGVLLYAYQRRSSHVGCEPVLGIGNRRRIRFLRPFTQQFLLNAGSRTTQRLKGAGNRHIAHPSVREHRPVR